MFKTSKIFLSAAVLVAMTATSAQAALINRGGGLIYDTTLNVTWLADLNYAQTQYAASNGAQGSSDGKMTWSQATAWASNLVYGIYDDWRLPTLNAGDTTCSKKFNPGGGLPDQYYGYNCTGGELSHLFVADLGNSETGGQITNQTGDTPEQKANLALFSHVQSDSYWSSLEFVLGFNAWTFDTYSGKQYEGVSMNSRAYAVAVRNGDVAAPPTVAVPEPQTLALTLLALGATALTTRRRASQL